MPMKEWFSVEALDIIIKNFDGEDIDGYEQMGNTFVGIGSFKHILENLDLDMKNYETPHARPSFEEPPILDL